MAEERNYEILESGPLLAFDLSMVDQPWTEGEGGGRLPVGSYEWIIHALGKGEGWYAAIFGYSKGPGEELHQEWVDAKRNSMMFFHFTDKLANWYYGFLGQVAPWCLWPGFAPPAHPQTGKPHFWHDWYSTGAKVRCQLVEEEYTSKKTGKRESRIKLQKNCELLEPSRFALGLLAVAGVDWRATVQPPTMQQIGQIFANPQQVQLAVQQGLAAIGQMPMMNLGGIVAPQFQAPQRQKPVA